MKWAEMIPDHYITGHEIALLQRLDADISREIC
jgi:hypothetical protein